MYLMVNNKSKQYIEKIKKISAMLALIKNQQRLDKIYDYVDLQYSNEIRERTK